LIGSPRNVLDIATGTGIWANEFAKANPSSTVIGSDLSMIQSVDRPTNCTFVQEDAEDPWIHQVKYDYIHLRYVYTCFDHPRTVVQSALNNLAPGGWIEFQDSGTELMSDGRDLEGTALQSLMTLVNTGAAALGRDFSASKHYKEWLIEAGCEYHLSSICQREYRFPKEKR
jgi:ubiquinone/menaquinone biosynthesis C-methylase UbiE